MNFMIGIRYAWERDRILQKVGREGKVERESGGGDRQSSRISKVCWKDEMNGISLDVQPDPRVALILPVTLLRYCITVSATGNSFLPIV